MTVRARELVQDHTLAYDQKLRRLAALATEVLPYPELSDACAAALDKRVICDMYEGNAPFTARYILPDYELAIRQGLSTISKCRRRPISTTPGVPADDVRQCPERHHLPGLPR